MVSTSLPYFGVKLSCVFLMIADRKKYTYLNFINIPGLLSISISNRYIKTQLVSKESVRDAALHCTTGTTIVNISLQNFYPVQKYLLETSMKFQANIFAAGKYFVQRY